MIRSIPMTICGILLAADLVCDIRGISFFRQRNSSVIWKYLRYIIASCAVFIFLFTKEFSSIRSAIRSNEPLYLALMVLLTLSLHMVRKRMESQSLSSTLRFRAYQAMKYIRWLPLISWLFKDCTLSEILEGFASAAVIGLYLCLFGYILFFSPGGSNYSNDYYCRREQRKRRDYDDEMYRKQHSGY